MSQQKWFFVPMGCAAVVQTQPNTTRRQLLLSFDVHVSHSGIFCGFKLRTVQRRHVPRVGSGL